jgi:FSR family fosmidomycin resistance protein-like MFS transporter
MRLLKDSYFLAVSLTHFVVDLLGSQIAILMAFFATTMGLSNSQIGLVVGGYSFTGAISQPFFGWLVDRVGPRWIAAGGVLWTGGFISIALSLQSSASLSLLVIAGLGSGAFHPAGTMEATRRGREHFVGRATTAASIFFLFGQGAFSIGPAVGGFILDKYSAQGLLFLTALAIPAGINAFLRLRPSKDSDDTLKIEAPSEQADRELKTGAFAILAFTLLVALRCWAYGNLAGFLPKYFLDGGLDLGTVGILAALYMGGSAIGNLLGGTLSDRWGRRNIILGSLILVTLAMYGFSQSGITNWIYLFSPLSGIFIGASQSAVVVLTQNLMPNRMAQNLMPNRMATASGLALGFMFSTEALGVYMSGLIADAYGLATVFQITPLLTLVAVMLALTMKTGSQSKSDTSAEIST